MERIVFNQAMDLVLRKYKKRLVVSFVLFSVFYGFAIGLLAVIVAYLVTAVGLSFAAKCACDKILNPREDNFCAKCGKEVPIELKPANRQ